jgi:hypothetical protein
MGQGREYLQRVNQAINEFEEAVVHRERKKLLESKVPLQQEANRARERLIKVVVDLVTEARVGQPQ